ncbi:MAG TPA: hypothetical protein VEK79_18365 [Thermoanaerobaculia bacterium]|nr:hypothetical protein [Thermoanaerobaculia bacterium]
MDLHDALADANRLRGGRKAAVACRCSSRDVEVELEAVDVGVGDAVDQDLDAAQARRGQQRQDGAELTGASWVSIETTSMYGGTPFGKPRTGFSPLPASSRTNETAVASASFGTPPFFNALSCASQPFPVRTGNGAGDGRTVSIALKRWWANGARRPYHEHALRECPSLNVILRNDACPDPRSAPRRCACVIC